MGERQRMEKGAGGCGARKGKEEEGAVESLGGASDQVEGSLVGKKGMLFSGNLESSMEHLMVKVGQFLEVLL